MTSIFLTGGWAITKQFPAQEEPRHKIVQNKPQKRTLRNKSNQKYIGWRLQDTLKKENKSMSFYLTWRYWAFQWHANCAQTTVAVFAAVNNLSRPLRHQMFTSAGSKDFVGRLWSVDFDSFCVFHGMSLQLWLTTAKKQSLVRLWICEILEGAVIPGKKWKLRIFRSTKYERSQFLGIFQH